MKRIRTLKQAQTELTKIERCATQTDAYIAKCMPLLISRLSQIADELHKLLGLFEIEPEAPPETEPEKK